MQDLLKSFWYQKAFQSTGQMGDPNRDLSMISALFGVAAFQIYLSSTATSMICILFKLNLNGNAYHVLNFKRLIFEKFQADVPHLPRLVNMLWMFDGIFETSKALKTFPSLPLVSLTTRNFSNIFHQIDCIECCIEENRAASGYFQRKVQSFHHHSSSFSPLLRLRSEFNSNFQFIHPRTEHLSSEKPLQNTILSLSIVSPLHRTILPINNSFERLKEKALYPVYFYGAVSSVLLRILKKSMQRKEIYPESACFDIYLVFKYSPTNSNMEKGQK